MQAESSKAVTSGTKGKWMDPSAKGSSISEVERIKMDIKRRIPESKLTFVWSKVVDTNVGHWDYEKFKIRMASHDLPLLVKRTLESKLAHVAGFPSIV